MKGKDLINIGIFSAIYFVIVFIVAMLGFVPIMLPMLAVLVPLLGGVPFELFLTRVNKFGMIWIMSIIMGLLMLITGMSWPPLAVSAVTGLLAELVFRAGRYRSAAMAVLTNAVFSLWVGANYLPLFFAADKYWESRKDFGQDYVDSVNKLMPNPFCSRVRLRTDRRTDRQKADEKAL